MLENKIIAGAEWLHKTALTMSMKMLNRRTKRAAAKLEAQQMAALRMSEAAMRVINKAGEYHQAALSKHTEQSLQINSLSNEIENRLDDLGFRPVQ